MTDRDLLATAGRLARAVAALDGRRRRPVPPSSYMDCCESWNQVTGRTGSD
jgi:hypothetical protein